MLTHEDGTLLTDEDAITNDAIEFYKSLLGKLTAHMLVAKPEVLKDGLVLQRE